MSKPLQKHTGCQLRDSRDGEGLVRYWRTRFAVEIGCLPKREVIRP